MRIKIRMRQIRWIRRVGRIHRARRIRQIRQIHWVCQVRRIRRIRVLKIAKIFNLMRSRQISQISHFRIKYEFGISVKWENFTPNFFFFLPFVAFIINAGEFSFLLRNAFFFFQIQFNHISKTARIYLDHYFIVCWNFNIFTTVMFCLHYFIMLKSLPNFVCSFIFDELTSKVADVSAVFPWSQ